MLFLFAGCFVLTAFAAASLVTLSRDATALRRSVVNADGFEADLRVQLSAGPVICTLVRSGLRWIDSVPPEAHQALAAVRGAGVAVYRLRHDASPADRAGAMAAADAEMRQRGWTRTVAVREGAEAVSIWTDPDTASSRQVRVCVAVCAQRDLVIVEARLRTKELMAFVEAHVPPLTHL